VVADLHLLKMLNCALKIFRILARPALPVRNQFHLPIKIKLVRILLMISVNNEAKCVNLGQRSIQQSQRPDDIKIDTGHLLALLKVKPRGVCMFWRNLVSKTATGTAAIQTENQPGAFLRSAMNMTKHAERPVVAV
jgi:hypothetical protein